MLIAEVTIWLAFSAGLLSFISPCTLPLYPAYLSYITGVSVQDIQTSKSKSVRLKVIVHSIFFLLGISSIYMSLGAGMQFIGSFLVNYGDLVQKISGLLMIVMGLFLIGFFNLDWLMKERRFQFTRKPVGFLGSMLIGIGFAAGWTPCIGPMITAIVGMSSANPSLSMMYMFMYVLGFSLPFLILSFFIGTTKWLIRYSSKIMKAGGALMIIMGILLYFDRLTDITAFLYQLFEGTWLGNIG